MRHTSRIISCLLILALAVITIKAGGFNKSDTLNTKQEKPEIEKLETDEIQKILESFMTNEDFNNKFFANKAGMKIEEFEKFLKKPITGEAEVCEDEILAVGCTRCNQGGKYIEVDRSCSTWSTTGTQRICTHKNFGVDLEYVRHCYSVKKCDKCGFQISGSWDENKWVCHGFNDGSITQ